MKLTCHAYRFGYDWKEINQNQHRLYCGTHVLGSLHRLEGEDKVWEWHGTKGVFYCHSSSPDCILKGALEEVKNRIEHRWSGFLGQFNITLLAPEKETPPPAQPLCEFSWASSYTVWGKEYYRLMCNFDSVGSLTPLPEGRVGWRWEPSAHACSPGASHDNVRHDYCGMSLDEAKAKVMKQWRRYAKMFLDPTAIAPSPPVAEEKREAISLPPIKFMWKHYIKPLDPKYVYYQLWYGNKAIGMLIPLPDSRQGWRWVLSLDAALPEVVNKTPDFLLLDFPGMLLENARERVIEQLSKYESLLRVAPANSSPLAPPEIELKEEDKDEVTSNPCLVEWSGELTCGNQQNR